MKEDERKKIKEPYDPRETPNPPQNVRPADSGEETEDKKSPAQEQNKGGRARESGHLLNEEADIDDETTI